MLFNSSTNRRAYLGKLHFLGEGMSFREKI
jgi:hypothetical protein